MCCLQVLVRICNEFYYREYSRYLSVIRGEQIGTSSLTNERVQQRNCNVACNHLLNSNYLPKFEKFSVLLQKNKKYNLELDESLLIIQDRSMNQDICSFSLQLLDLLLANIAYCAL